jgi:hypothetical protein
MAQTLESLEAQFPWHFRTLKEKGIAVPKIKDIPNPLTGDLALGDDGLVYLFDGKGWR